jgi:hypothetical protein
VPLRCRGDTTREGSAGSCRDRTTRPACAYFTLDRNDFETYRIKRGHRLYPVEII